MLGTLTATRMRHALDLESFAAKAFLEDLCLHVRWLICGIGLLSTSSTAVSASCDQHSHCKEVHDYKNTRPVTAKLFVCLSARFCSRQLSWSIGSKRRATSRQSLPASAQQQRQGKPRSTCKDIDQKTPAKTVIWQRHRVG